MISNVANKLPDEVLQRVYGPPAYIDSGKAKVQLENSVKLLQNMGALFNINYSLPKIDQVLIPNYKWGAMENWGMVVYEESRLEYDEFLSPYTQLHASTIIVAHELVHQWFGNLVTPQWWEYLWLKEGFATLYENIFTNSLYPDMRLLDYVVVNECQEMFNLDADELTRPMSLHVDSSDEIHAAHFDQIPYKKGRSFFNYID
jgi:aminopeptidase N